VHARQPRTAGLRVGRRGVCAKRHTTYRDRVRGEYLHPWGVAEAQRLGLEETLIASGGTWITEAVGYDELVAPTDAPVLRIRDFRPDMPGAMDLGHPQACAALADAAISAGVEVLRGVGDVSVTAGPEPSVCYELDDVEHELRCRRVVGADGRASSVRRQLGLELHETEPRTWGSGMLAEGLESLPHQGALGTEDDSYYLIFPRDGGIARLYLWYACIGPVVSPGRNRQREFLDSFRMNGLPYGTQIAASEPAGPCAKYPMNDTWTDEVAVSGVVLIGMQPAITTPSLGKVFPSHFETPARSPKPSPRDGTGPRKHSVPTRGNDRSACAASGSAHP
jgi:2-polyprenyl-6-methoxyphenol hydroxylase-like FAD-dependent oxidoreductase